MERFNPRVGYLGSVAFHLVIVIALMNRPPRPVTQLIELEEIPEIRRRVFLPPPEVLREALSPPAARPVVPRPTVQPTPPARPPVEHRDKMSIGSASTERSREPLILRPDQDLTSGARGDRTPRKGEVAAQPSPAPLPAAALKGIPPPVPPALADAPLVVPRTEGGAEEAPSLASSLRRLDERLAGGQGPGLPTGTGQQVGAFFFDPEGADFTAWINHLKNEVYRNWILPPSAIMGARGHVDLEFTVQRDGRMSDVRVLKSSGTPALDRAARNALLGSRLHPLPDDFRPAAVTIQVSFFYNQEPRSS
jgi:protein TonB